MTKGFLKSGILESFFFMFENKEKISKREEKKDSKVK